MEKIMGMSSKYFTTIFIVCLPTLLILTMMYQNSIFEKFSITKILEGKTPNATLRGKDPNAATEKLLEARPQNANTTTEILRDKSQDVTGQSLEGRVHNITGGAESDSSSAGSKTHPEYGQPPRLPTGRVPDGPTEKKNISQITSITDDKLANDSKSDGFPPSENDQAQATGMPDDKLVNCPRTDASSPSENDQAQATGMPDDKLANSPRTDASSPSENDQAQATGTSDDKLTNSLRTDASSPLENDQAPAPGMPDDKLANSPRTDASSPSEDDQARATGMPDDKLANSPRTDASSPLENDLAQAPGMPDDKLANSPRIDASSPSENDHAQAPSMPDEKLANASTSDVSTPSAKNQAQAIGTPREKLLDGLLAPGLDERSCLSRYQSYLYRRASSHKPSPYLISKLRNYEGIHKRCGPRTKSYNRIVRRLTKESRHRNVTTTTCKYIVWTAANGLGNRMVSMASAFLYAVLTDRVLLVQFGKDMIGLVCEPFPKSSWLVPDKFPYINEVSHIRTYDSMLEDPGEFLPPLLFLNLQHGSDDHEKLFHCDHSQAVVRRVPALILRSDQYFVPSLFMTPSFQQELSKMFPEKETVFYHLGHYLFQPSNEVWQVITQLHEAHLAKADERIGLQIRGFVRKGVPIQSVVDQILTCTLIHKLLPEVDMQKSISSPWKNGTSKVVLVTSLYPEYAEKLGTIYSTRPTVSGEAIEFYQPSHEGRQKWNDKSHNIKAWTEIYLLSLCDVLLTSGASTFGYVAQSLGGLKPWILKKLLHEKIPDPPCRRAPSMEPCFHFPPTHDCQGKTITYDHSLFSGMRPCVDRRSGVKLVNDL